MRFLIFKNDAIFTKIVIYLICIFMNYFNKLLFLRISRNDEDLFILELFMFFVLCYSNKFDKLIVDKLMI